MRGLYFMCIIFSSNLRFVLPSIYSHSEFPRILFYNSMLQSVMFLLFYLPFSRAKVCVVVLNNAQIRNLTITNQTPSPRRAKCECEGLVIIVLFTRIFRWKSEACEMDDGVGVELI